MRRTVLLTIAIAGTLACSLVTTPPSTPTAPPPSNTPPPSRTPNLPTLIPTPTTLSTVTPIFGISTPRPFTAVPVVPNSNSGAIITNNPNASSPSSGGGIAPVGVRETPVNGGVGSGTGSIGSGSSGQTRVITAVPPAQIDAAAVALTPTPGRITEQFEAEVGSNSRLVLDLDAEINGGNVVVWVSSEDGVLIWLAEFAESIDAEIEVDVPGGGVYVVSTFAVGLRGNYALAYGVRGL